MQSGIPNIKKRSLGIGWKEEKDKREEKKQKPLNGWLLSIIFPIELEMAEYKVIFLILIRALIIFTL